MIEEAQQLLFRREEFDSEHRWKSAKFVREFSSFQPPEPELRTNESSTRRSSLAFWDDLLLMAP